MQNEMKLRNILNKLTLLNVLKNCVDYVTYNNI